MMKQMSYLYLFCTKEKPTTCVFVYIQIHIYICIDILPFLPCETTTREQLHIHTCTFLSNLLSKSRVKESENSGISSGRAGTKNLRRRVTRCRKTKDPAGVP
ncbi:unnamed protein product [Cuscuta epithymum]|uniref:Uncharacterized protein n=1 Tax=Cuscuta epithymum TaxID=186058 RepID=A0AAV0EEA1_9ASTE|nr:unnamed protein product [Cuscuta epithymum]